MPISDWIRWAAWAATFWDRVIPGNGWKTTFLVAFRSLPAAWKSIRQNLQSEEREKVPSVVAMNGIVERTLARTVQEIFDGDAYLRLFQSDQNPTPANTLPGSFVEADFENYIPLPVAEAFPPGIEIVAGRWRSRSAIQVWIPPTTGEQTVYGWFVTIGPEVIFAARFASPIVMKSDLMPLAITVDLEAIARSLLSC